MDKHPSDPEPEIWFPAKRYGWGWGLPCHRKGWWFLLIWLIVFLAGTFGLLLLTAWQMPMWLWFTLFYGWMFVMSVWLIAVCRAKGERPRWRWGD